MIVGSGSEINILVESSLCDGTNKPLLVSTVQRRLTSTVQYSYPLCPSNEFQRTPIPL